MEFFLMVPVFFAFLRGSVWPLLALLFFMGTQSALFSPLKYAYIPQMLEERELLRGNAYVNAGTYVAVIFGAVIGNYLITLPRGGLVTGSVILLVAILGLSGAFLIPEMKPEAPSLRLDPNLIRASWDILKTVYRDKVLTHCVNGLSTFWMTASLYASLLAGFCKDILHAETHLVPILYLLFSAGVAIGSVLCQFVGHRRAVMPLVSPALILMAFFTLDLFFAARSWGHVPADADALFTVGELLKYPASWRIAADLVLLAACGGFYSVPLNALLQHKADPEQVARAVAANNIVNSFAIALGTVVTAPLMAHEIIGTAGVFMLVAVVNFLTALYLLGIRSERLPRK